jgi:predicted transposase YbfD/YdcC
MDWVNSVSQLTQGEVIALDGQTLRRSHDRPAGKAALHMVSAWASENFLVLGQVKVGEKSNEITAIPELLNLLDVSGCIVTIDAMGCPKKLARQIVGQEADYVLSVKESQGKLREDVADLFSCGQRTGFADMQHAFCPTVGSGHGRVETRRCWTIDAPEQLSYLDTPGEWPGLRSIGMVTAELCQGDQVSVETRYYSSSLELDARRFLRATRRHWGIENRLHWALDVSFREDESRVRTGNAPENLALVRHMALNLLRQDQTRKAAIKAKRKLAGWDNNYLLSILSH